MVGVVYDRMIAVDTSAVIALLDSEDQFHELAQQFFENAQGFTWLAVNITSHELFTRVRYDEDLPTALSRYDFIRGEGFDILNFDTDDEIFARQLLEKYNDQTLSFHDALCAAVMLREGIFKVFSFDRDFWVLGFEVFPGTTAPKR
jgi:predicted nucleic acid-binding protein